jgi:alkylation response protein AidB-like acyl-CoA dehydrogenase
MNSADIVYVCLQVFANLILPGGRNEGFHAFLVPIRDKDGKPMPGVGIADCGYKMGLNGVDNGRLWFNGVRVPRDNLLNKVSTPCCGPRVTILLCSD